MTIIFVKPIIKKMVLGLKMSLCIKNGKKENLMLKKLSSLKKKFIPFVVLLSIFLLNGCYFKMRSKVEGKFAVIETRLDKLEKRVNDLETKK